MRRSPALFGFAGGDRRRRIARGQRAEVLLGPRLDLVRFNVSHYGHHGVAGTVVSPEVLSYLSPGQGRQVGCVSGDGNPVWMDLERGGEESVLEHAAGARLQSQPALLRHHVELGVELAEDGAGHSIRLEREPQLGAVGGKLDEVAGRLVAGDGVEAAGAFGGEKAVELVGHDQGAGLVLQRADHAPEAQKPSRVREGCRLLQDEGVAGRVDRVEENRFAGRVRDSDLVGALEHHVLQNVGDPSVAQVLVDRAHRVVEDQRHGGGLTALQHQEGHPVGQDVADHGEGLARGGDRLHRQARESGERRKDRRGGGDASPERDAVAPGRAPQGALPSRGRVEGTAMGWTERRSWPEPWQRRQ